MFSWQKLDTFSFNSVEQAQERCHYWQCLLRLADWEIIVSICRADELPDAHAEITYDSSKKQAFLRLLHQDDWDPEKEFVLNQEKGLLHELVHLHLLVFDKTIEEDTTGLLHDALEVAVDSIARGMLQSSISVVDLP